MSPNARVVDGVEVHQGAHEVLKVGHDEAEVTAPQDAIKSTPIVPYRP